jgi:autophagy-related protein 9
MNSNYHGYVQANQSIVEENGEDDVNNGEDVDLEAGRSGIFHSSHEAKRLSIKSQGKRRVAWNPEASEMGILHPNIHKEDKIHERDSSDDEVPPSFLIEATSHPMASSKTAEQPQKQNHGRGHALYSTEGRKLPPSSSPKFVSKPISKSKSPVSTSPRPSDLAEEPISGEFGYSSPPPQDSPYGSHKPMRGLDDYERALWNWINVYNLDAFLQEVYYYYDGKGIYSIALSRGLNLLLVTFALQFVSIHTNLSPVR